MHTVARAVCADSVLSWTSANVLYSVIDSIVIGIEAQQLVHSASLSMQLCSNEVQKYHLQRISWLLVAVSNVHYSAKLAEVKIRKRRRKLQTK